MTSERQSNLLSAFVRSWPKIRAAARHAATILTSRARLPITQGTDLWEEEVYIRYRDPTIITGVPTTAQSPNTTIPIHNCHHPEYDAEINEWQQWREVYDAGRPFKEKYLVRYSKRERDREYQSRKAVSTIPAFSAAAINDIRNAIFHRMSDIAREGGTDMYQRCITGLDGGVDRQGSTMNWFLGSQVITELLVMKRVGIFVDRPVGDVRSTRPYLYKYCSEDILNWRHGDDGQLLMLILRDHIDKLHPRFQVPIGCTEQYRYLYIRPDGTVGVVLFDANGKMVSQLALAITQIPFVMPRISQSLMRDVAGHQIALLNLESTDIGTLLKSNFPLYTEQTRGDGADHLKRPKIDVDGSAELGPDEIEAGGNHGRRYGVGLERPGFIAPPTEPLKASMDKQSSLKDDIRLLVNLSLSAIKPGAASAESKQQDLQGLESGLSNIGLELEHAERQIEQIWASYEGAATSAKIKYPDRYSLKSDTERRQEVKDYQALRGDVPSPTFQRLITKKCVDILLGDRVPSTLLAKIHQEIDSSPVLTTNQDVLIAAGKEGLVTKDTISKALGFPDGEVDKAKAEHIARLTAIAMVQGTLTNPSGGAGAAARGVPDLGGDPNAGSNEKIGKPKRGQGQNTQGE